MLSPLGHTLAFHRENLAINFNELTFVMNP